MRSKLAALLLLLLGALTVYGLFHEHLFALTTWSDSGVSRFLAYAGAYAVAAAVILWRWPGQLLRIVFVAAIVYAAWWAGPLAPLAVLYFLGSSYALGRILAKGLNAILTTLLGAGVWSLVLWSALHFPVNYWWSYAVAFAVPFLFVRPSFVPPVVLDRKAGAGLALLLGLLGAQFLASLKPEISADALSMHLTLPAAVAHQGFWAFDHRTDIWSLMPAGADALFAGVYLLGGEFAAKLLNFAFLVLTAFLVLDTARKWVSPMQAYLASALFVSTPLVLLVTGSLFVENVWAALLLGSAVALIDSRFGVAAALGAIAVTVKLIAAAFAAPLLVLAFWWAGAMRWRVAALWLLALPPYVFAYARSGNPVFPFANTIFRSPDYYTNADFKDVRFDELGIEIGTPYDLTFRSTRYIEGQAGSAGFQYLLLLLPAAVLAKRREQWILLATLAIGSVGVMIGAPNLRYLYGALPLASVAIAWTPWTALLPVVTALNLWFLPAAGYYDRDFALFRKSDIEPYLASTEPARLLIERLNREHPGQPVAFFATGATAGLRARTYSDNWHNEHYWQRVRDSGSPVEIAAHLRGLGVTYVVGPTDRRAAFDVVQRFLEKHLEPEPNGRIGALTLYRLYPEPAVAPKPTGPFGPGTYDNRDERIEYSGRWFHDNQFAEPFEHSLSYADQAGASLTLSFTGRSVQYIFTRASNRGVAEVWLDGALARTVDLYSRQTKWQAQVEIETTPGTHRLEVRVTGRKSSASAGAFVDLDAIRVE